MTGQFSDVLEAALLGHVFGGAAFPPPAATWVGLTTTPPAGAFAGTEVVGGGYVRMQAVWSSPSGSPPFVLNAQDIQWAAATADWGLIVGVDIYSAPSFGMYLCGGLLVNPADNVTPRPVQINQGDIFRIPIQGMTAGFSVPPPVPGLVVAGAGPAAQTRPHVPPPWPPAIRARMRSLAESIRARP
jgi:hypothetical protein